MTKTLSYNVKLPTLPPGETEQETLENSLFPNVVEAQIGFSNRCLLSKSGLTLQPSRSCYLNLFLGLVE